MPPYDRRREDDKRYIQQDRRRRGQTENMKTVQYRHRQRRHSDKQNVGKHQAIQIDSFDLYLILSEHRKQADRQRRKNYAQNRQSGQNSGKRPKQSIRERPGFLAGAIPDGMGEKTRE